MKHCISNFDLFRTKGLYTVDLNLDSIKYILDLD